MTTPLVEAPRQARRSFASGSRNVLDQTLAGSTLMAAATGKREKAEWIGVNFNSIQEHDIIRVYTNGFGPFPPKYLECEVTHITEAEETRGRGRELRFTSRQYHRWFLGKIRKPGSYIDMTEELAKTLHVWFKRKK